MLLGILFPFSLTGLYRRFTLVTNSGTGNIDSQYNDPRFKRILWSLIAGTRGGANRAKILYFINSRPANANQIAIELKLDYKTVLHHIRALSENGLIVTENKEAYGAMHFISPLMEKNFQVLQEILAKIGKK